MKKLVIYGTAYPDTVKLVEAINRANPEWEILGYIDDRQEYQGKVLMGYPILGDRNIVSELVKDENTYFFNNYYNKLENFKERVAFLESFGCKIPSLIHPSVDTNHVSIGRGCIIADGCKLGSKVEIGDFVTMRLRSLISHDVKIEDYAFIAPGVTIGSCLTIKENSFVGAGATVMRTKNIGKNSVVGAGAVVVSDVSDGITVVGIPAKKFRKNLIRRIIRRIRRDIKNIRKNWLLASRY